MSRLTRKNKYEGETLYGSPIETKCDDFDQLQNVYNKLGQLEDLMENYNINELWELEMILDYYEHRFDDVQTRRVDENEI